MPLPHSPDEEPVCTSGGGRQNQVPLLFDMLSDILADIAQYFIVSTATSVSLPSAWGILHSAWFTSPRRLVAARASGVPVFLSMCVCF